MVDGIARVFPRKTSFTPDDDLAFTRPLMIEDYNKDIKEVHISCTFTYDLPKVDELYESWYALGVPVKVGGPAFDDRMGDFTPGMYVKKGITFTSRGCTKDCWFCSVPKCAHGIVKELPIQDGFNIADDNILGTSEKHFRSVIEMLKNQKEKAVFSGGLEPNLLQQWQADLLYSIKPSRMFTAYDTKDDLEPLIEMGKKFRQAGFSATTHALACYVLIGYENDSFEDAQKRMKQTMDAGFMPFAMLYRNEDGVLRPDWKGFQREWANPFIVGKKYSEYKRVS